MKTLWQKKKIMSNFLRLPQRFQSFFSAADASVGGKAFTNRVTAKTRYHSNKIPSSRLHLCSIYVYMRSVSMKEGMFSR